MKTLSFILCLLKAGIVHAQTLTPLDVNREVFATGLNAPVALVNCGDDRVFVVEQNQGDIEVLDKNTGAAISTFLDVTGLITTGGERGLLGLAFHPNYSENGYFYVNYTDLQGNTKIVRYSVSEADPNVADPNSAVVILTVPQPYGNHNGGCIAFGPDGYLYIGMGDGGGGGDPFNNAQAQLSLLGKMLRIDVDNGFPYSIPPDNPFVGNGNYAPEIWALGLRNPWRWSFDAANGDLWIGDVGQNIREEVDVIRHGESGLNFGWRCYEGNAVYNATGCADASTFDAPVVDMLHSQGWAAVVGGYVHRGTRFPGLNGWYMLTDYGHGDLYAFKADGSTGYNLEFMEVSPSGASSLGVDNDGELYLINISGTIWRLVDPCGSFSPQLQGAGNGLQVVGGEAQQYWWYNNATLIDGATTVNYTPTAPGNYYAIANNGTCTRQTATVQWITVSGIGGCTYPLANNYTPGATVDDGSCQFGTPAACPGDMDANGFININDLSLFLQVFGGTCN